MKLFWILIVGAARGLSGYTNANAPSFGEFGEDSNANWIIFTSSTDLVNYVNTNGTKQIRIFAGNEYSLSVSPKLEQLNKVEPENHTWVWVHDSGEKCMWSDAQITGFGKSGIEAHRSHRLCTDCGRKEKLENGIWIKEN